MISHIDPKVDYAFKRIFGTEPNVPVLIDILDAVLRPLPKHRLFELEIHNPFKERETADDKLFVVDIKARDQSGRLYNVEMQMYGTLTYPRRVLYYWASLYASQLSKGDNYAKLQKTISVSFVNDVLFPEVPDWHLCFHLRSPNHPNLVFCELQEMHVIELPKFRKSAEELTDPLDVWCYFLKNAADLDSENLPVAMCTPAVRKAMEVLNVISQSDLEHERYLARLRLERDHMMFIDEAREARERGLEEGRQEGREEGRQEGRQEGELIGRILICQHFLKLAPTPREQLEALSLEVLQDLAKNLEQQAGLPQN